MPDAKDGLTAAIAGTLYQVVLFAILKAIPQNYFSPSMISLLEIVVSLAGLITFIGVAKYWSTGYILGAIFGNVICYYAGLTGLIELAFLMLFSMMMLLARFGRR